MTHRKAPPFIYGENPVVRYTGVQAFIFLWVRADNPKRFGLFHANTMGEAKEYWKNEIDGVCIFDEPTGTCYLWPDHPNSVEDPKKLAKKILEGGGYKVKDYVTLPPPEQEGAPAEASEDDQAVKEKAPSVKEEPPSDGEKAESVKEGPEPDGKVKRQPTTRDIQATLTDQDLAECAREMASLQRKIELLDEDKKATMSDFKARREELENQLGEVAEKVRIGHENRVVSCEEVFDFEAGEVRVVQPDTGEVLETRPMTDHDREQRLFDNEPPPQEPEEEPQEEPQDESQEGPDLSRVAEVAQAIPTYWSDNPSLAGKEPTALALTEYLGGGWPAKEEIEAAMDVAEAMRVQQESNKEADRADKRAD